MEELSWKDRKLSQDYYLAGISYFLNGDNVNSRDIDELGCRELGKMLKRTSCFDYTINGDYIVEMYITKRGLFMGKIDFFINLFRRDIYIST